jgi:hypothetical protein
MRRRGAPGRGIRHAPYGDRAARLSRNPHDEGPDTRRRRRGLAPRRAPLPRWPALLGRRTGPVSPVDVSVVDEARRRLTRRYGPAVETWLADLPARLAVLRDRWGLELDAAIPQGSMSVVLRCRTVDRQAAILKLAPDTRRLAREASALRRWAGRRAPTVLAADIDLGALLLVGHATFSRDCSAGTLRFTARSSISRLNVG